MKRTKSYSSTTNYATRNGLVFTKARNSIGLISLMIGKLVEEPHIKYSASRATASSIICPQMTLNERDIDIERKISNFVLLHLKNLCMKYQHQTTKICNFVLLHLKELCMKYNHYTTKFISLLKKC